MAQITETESKNPWLTGPGFYNPQIEDQQEKINKDEDFRGNLTPAKGTKKVVVDEDGEIYWAKPDEDLADVTTRINKRLQTLRRNRV